MKITYSIQYLRALAALAVVAFHMGFSIGIPNLFPVGAAGVDIFFCISGFIMFSVTDNKEAAPATFAWNRIRRIVPLYWIATAITAAVFLVRPHFIYGSDANPQHIIKSLFFIPTRDLTNSNYPIVRQGWTLNIEIFFYVILFLALFLPKKFQIISVTVLLFLFSMIGIFHSSHDPIISTYTNPRILEFVAGLWLGVMTHFERLPSRFIGIASAALGIALLLGPTLWSVTPPPRLEFLYWGIPSFMIVFGVVTIEQRGGVWRWKFGLLLGDASYSIYLLHSLTLGLVAYAHVPLWLKIISDMPVTVAICVAAFLFVEKPIMRVLRRIGPPKLGLAIA